MANRSRLLAALLLLPLCSAAAEDAKPIPKVGACPPGYHGSGKYCVPPERVKPAIEKLGACPPGYYSGRRRGTGRTGNSGFRGRVRRGRVP